MAAMMLRMVSGNIFSSTCRTLTNPVNCVGVMGRGLAAEFKRRYPPMFEDYRERCGQGEVKIGEPYLWKNGEKWVLNFPTKRHWREPSEAGFIAEGLAYTAEKAEEWGLVSLAVPALGCGLGGLGWEEVRKIMLEYLPLEGTEVEIFVPGNGNRFRREP